MSTEYIERGKVFRAMSDSLSECDAVAKIKAIPAADVEPVVHARWEGCELFDWKYFKCTNCGEIISGFPLYPYCHNCGALMDERSEHED